MAKIKVLALSFLFPNAQQPNHGIFVYNRLNALSKYADIKVINPIPWSPVHAHLSQYSDFDKVPEKTKLGNLDVYHPRFLSIPKYLKSIESLSYYLSVKRVLNTELKEFDFDLIDLHWTYPDLPSGLVLSNRYKAPFIATLRGYEAFHIPDPGIRKNIVKYCLNRADKVIALSEDLKKLSISLGTAEDKHQVIRNGVDVERFSYIPSAEARIKLCIPEDEKVIISIGRLVKPKGFDLIIQALPDVIKKTGLTNIKLYIIGQPDPGDDFTGELRKQISLLGLDDNVIFQGGVPNQDLVTWYNAADIFCLASRGEGSPNVLTEALSCGCPSVATDVGAVKEIINSEPNIGRCVESDNAASLAFALSEVLVTDFDRAGNADRYSCYNWEWCANSVYKVYEDVLRKPDET